MTKWKEAQVRQGAADKRQSEATKNCGSESNLKFRPRRLEELGEGSGAQEKR
jgi:hypothetical protein